MTPQQKEIIGALIGIPIALWFSITVLQPAQEHFPPIWHDILTLSLVAVLVLAFVRRALSTRYPQASRVANWTQDAFFVIGVVYPAIRFSVRGDFMGGQIETAWTVISALWWLAMLAAVSVPVFLLYLAWRLVRAVERLADRR